MEAALLQLPSLVSLSPDGRAALERFCEALKRHGHLDTFSSLLEWWASLRVDVLDGRRAVAALYVKLAERARDDDALRLYRQALDLWPGCYEAVTGLEHGDDLLSHERLELYNNFLEVAPFSERAALVRQHLIDLLVELGDYEAAMIQLELLPRVSPELGTTQIVRACSIAPVAIDVEAEDEVEAHASPVLEEPVLFDLSFDGLELDDDAGATLILDERDIEFLDFARAAQA